MAVAPETLQKIKTQSMMQFFGGKTGGKEIETLMNGLGLQQQASSRKAKPYSPK